jgi:GDPmannose 4,6-dehydratase
MKKALITGVAGQDGSYLAELLLSEGMEVFGIVKSGADLKYVPSGVEVFSGDLADSAFLIDVVQRVVPDEVYNLAGVTTLKEAYENPEKTWKINYESVGVLVDASLRMNPLVRFLQASSSEIFLPSEHALHEESPRDWETKNPYAKAKMAADRDFIETARREKGAFACSAFLFNHESPRRREDAALRKITRGLVKIHLGMESKLLVGNVEQLRDWGFAGDYVVAMRKMLQQEVPEDFVIATGTLYSVREVVELVANELAMKNVWEVVEVSPEFFHPTERNPKFGDIQRAEMVLRWKPTTDFRSLIKIMIDAEVRRFSEANR